VTVPTSAEALAEQAEEAAETHPTQATALARQALEAEPANGRAANVLGVLAYADGRIAEAEKWLKQACSSPAADDDMRANLERVTSELGPLGYHPSSTRLGAAFAAGRDAVTNAQLDRIPSATTPGERNLIRAFAAELWNGRDDVFENGPLLGGTTRALALGMLANPAREPSARLQTHDWFNAGVALDVPPQSFDALIAQGALDPAARDEMNRTGSFKPVFDDVHSGQDYSGFLVSHTAALPGTPEDEQTMADLFAPDPEATWNLLLVDGCKSWYGTRYFLEKTAAAIPAGSHIMMQDYGWYSCFWLTSMVGLWPERFRLIAHIDATYGFEVSAPIDPAEVRDGFPVSPEALGAPGFDDLYGDLLRRAEGLADSRLRVALTLHNAAAHAYLDDKERARAMIDALAQEPWAAPHRGHIEAARRRPTYRPDMTSIDL
jgi:hypothetical protein